MKKTKSKNYRVFVGPADKYDLVAAMQFNLLTFLGLREFHYLLDIGCGSLRGGRLFIPYLLPGHYFGIEPEKWLIEEGIKKEIGEDLIKIKKPVFSNNSDFSLSVFNKKFDFILAQSIFSHTSSRQIEKCLSEVAKVMKPSSIFAATFVEGEENYKGEKWVYPECVTFTLEYIVNLAKKYNLICRSIDWPHPNGQTWLLITQRNERNILNLNSFFEVFYLKQELEFYKERLSKIENHPYVKIGKKINQIIKKLKL